MYIEVTPTGTPTVQEPGDFSRLSIVANVGSAPAAVVDVLLSSGLAVTGSTPDAIKLDVAAFRDTARAALAADPTPEWERDFDAMLDYAQRKGWYHPDTGAVAAHLEWTETTR